MNKNGKNKITQNVIENMAEDIILDNMEYKLSMPILITDIDFNTFECRIKAEWLQRIIDAIELGVYYADDQICIHGGKYIKIMFFDSEGKIHEFSRI